MEPVQKPLLALGLRLASALVLATLFMLVKYTVETGVAFAEVLFWRQLPTVLLIPAWLAMSGGIARLKTRRLPIHARRAVLGTIGMAFTFGAPLLLPLAESTALGFTSTVFAVILSALLLKERVGPVRWLAVALGFTGVLIITQPGHSALPPLGAAVGLGAGFMVALISIQVRDLARTDEALSIVFWFAALSSPVLLVGALLTGTAHNPWQWALLLACGVLGCLGQVLLTAALRFGQVASVIVMDYSSIIWATLYGWLIWGDLPAAATWLGAPAIVAAGVVIAWREYLHHRRIATSSPE